jgi:uncharacterized protein
MVLEGVVTNVAAFGAFVDIGVHQDGLVHVSAMSNSFVADPRDVAKSGDVVKVKVQSVDTQRNRISLTMRLQEEGGPGASDGRSPRGAKRDPQASARTSPADSGRPRSSARPGDNRRGGGPGDGTPAGRPGDRPRGDARQAPGGRPAGPGNDGRGGSGQRGGPAGTGNDRRGSGSGAPNDRRAAGPGNPNDRRGGGGQSGERRNAQPAPANSAMAEALRRAGLVDDKGAKPGKQDRRQDRP